MENSCSFDVFEIHSKWRYKAIEAFDTAYRTVSLWLAHATSLTNLAAISRTLSDVPTQSNATQILLCAVIGVREIPPPGIKVLTEYIDGNVPRSEIQSEQLHFVPH